MQGRFVAGMFLLALLSTVAPAQTTVPVYPNWNQPLVTTPILTLGNGLTTGPTITYSGDVGTTSPLDISGLQPRIDYGLDETPAEPRDTRAEWNRSGAANLDSAYAISEFAVSLGSLTQSLKINRPEYAHRSFTNVEVEQIVAQDSGRTGVIEARTAKGPIVPRSWSEESFQPETGIANQPFPERSQAPAYANGDRKNTPQPKMHFFATTPSLDGPAVPEGDKSALPAGEPD